MKQVTIQIYCYSFLDEMQEVLLYFPQVKDINPSVKIEDLHLIKDIVAKFGYKMRLVAHPQQEEKEDIVSHFVDVISSEIS